jgi:hypothetical protein
MANQASTFDPLQHQPVVLNIILVVGYSLGEDICHETALIASRKCTGLIC